MTPTFRLPAVAALTTALLVLGACSSSDDGAEDAENPATDASAASTVIDFEADGGREIQLTKPADVAKLEGAPDDFKQFIAGVTDNAAEASTEECPVEVSVGAIHPDGYASGAVVGCGGAIYLWGKRDGVWQRIWFGQDLPACDELTKLGVPVEIAPDQCYDGKDAVDYEG